MQIEWHIHENCNSDEQIQGVFKTHILSYKLKGNFQIRIRFRGRFQQFVWTPRKVLNPKRAWARRAWVRAKGVQTKQTQG